jgi:rod shape determining protein RodA
MAASRLTAEIDRPLLVVSIVLALIGITFVYSSTASAVMEAKQGLYLKQLLWLGIGLIGAAAVAAVPYRIYEGKSAYLLYGVGLAMLLLTLFVGHVGLGAQRWLGWGSVKFQPSELAKVATVLVLATVLSDRKTDLTKVRSLVKPCLLAAIPFALVLKQPDLGTSVSFFMILLTMLFWGGLPLLYLFLLVTPLINVVLSFYLPLWILFAAVLAFVLYRSRLRLMPILVVVALNLAVGVVTPQVWNHLEPYQRPSARCSRSSFLV